MTALITHTSPFEHIHHLCHMVIIPVIIIIAYCNHYDWIITVTNNITARERANANGNCRDSALPARTTAAAPREREREAGRG